MKRIWLLVGFISALLVTPLSAMATPITGMDRFNVRSAVATAELRATVAHVGFNLNAIPPSAFGGNTIDNKSFENVNGVIAVSQNTGANAIVQQAVIFQSDKLIFDIFN